MPTTGGDTYSMPHSLFSRACVECQDGSPACPSCASGESCQVSVPMDCSSCPQAYCAISTSSSSSSSSSGSKSSTGAIAGGVVGGVFLLGLVAVGVYLVWKHKIKGKREFEQEGWDGQYADSQQEKGFQSRRVTAATGATSQGRNSIASTVLTRASNIIQIAYIPGVTNRATPTSPTLLVPPVPPIPAMGSQAGTPNSTEDQHFFVPGDLRDSVCSGVSGYTDRTSFARASYAPRSSVASTIYGKAGVIVTPAQTGMRAKAAMVSVKSILSNSSSEGLAAPPPVPAIDHRKYAGNLQKSPTESTFSVGSTFLNNATSANTATAVRAQVVRVGSSLKSSTKSEDVAEMTTAPQTPNTPKTPLTNPQQEQQSPFRDPPEERPSSNKTLSAVIEEATKRASQRPATADRAKSPFGDEHASDQRSA